MKPSELLEKSKTFLWNGENTIKHSEQGPYYRYGSAVESMHICVAVQVAAGIKLGSGAIGQHYTASQVLQVIEQDLHPHKNMEDWLKHNVQGYVATTANMRERQTHRLGYINSLIERFKRTGQ